MSSKNTTFRMSNEMKDLANRLSLEDLLTLAMIEAGFKSASNGQKYELGCIVNTENAGTFKFSLVAKAEPVNNN